MLIKVTVENFKSFSEPTEMTMISSTKIQKGTDHRVKIKSTNILKYAVIYGANAAGKSNLIDFFWFLKSTLNDTIPMVATKWFCKCKEENINKNLELVERLKIIVSVSCSSATAVATDSKCEDIKRRSLTAGISFFA